MHLLGLERAHKHVIEQTGSKSWGHFLRFYKLFANVAKQIKKLNFALSRLEEPQTWFQFIYPFNLH